MKLFPNNNKVLLMLKGLPGCGKSTFAREQAETWRSKGIKTIISNKDLLREMQGGREDKGKGVKEGGIIDLRNAILRQAILREANIIVDDTNLNPIHEKSLDYLAFENGYRFMVADFTDADPIECISRDSGRVKSVGSNVIWQMWHKYILPEPRPDVPGRTQCVIVDIDGTIAKMNGRGPYEEQKVYEDLPRYDVINAACSLGYATILVSGRTDSCRSETERWLKDKTPIKYASLFMCKTGDSRDDTIVKEEIFRNHIEPFFDVKAIFDDRPKVIRMWQRLGFKDRIFNVGTGEEF